MGTQAPISERDERLARTRAAMAEANLDALIVAGKGHWWTGRGYVRYFTDFHLWGHDVLICIPKDGDPFLVCSSYAVAERIVARGWINEGRGDVMIAPRMVEMMTEKKLTKGRVGIAGYRFILSVGNHDVLKAGLPDVEFVNADDLIDRIRAVKSPLEIQQIREHMEVTKAALERFQQIVEPGKTQRELSAECSRVALERGVRDILVFISEEPGVNLPSDAPITCKGLLRFHMEMSGESGHWSELTLNLAFTQPLDLDLKMMESEHKAFARLQKIGKPGARLSELAQEFEASLREDGWELDKPTTAFDFHGQGMDTIERPWHAAQKPWGQSQDWPLEAGMVFSYHPHRSVTPKPVWGTGLNEDVLITENGIERLTVDWNQRWRPMW
jgi:Xaa-Pro aminopeptidase